MRGGFCFLFFWKSVFLGHPSIHQWRNIIIYMNREMIVLCIAEGQNRTKDKWRQRSGFPSRLKSCRDCSHGVVVAGSSAAQVNFLLSLLVNTYQLAFKKNAHVTYLGILGDQKKWPKRTRKLNEIWEIRPELTWQLSSGKGCRGLRAFSEAAAAALGTQLQPGFNQMMVARIQIPVKATVL